MTNERRSGHVGDRLHAGSIPEAQPTFVDTRYTSALAQVVSSNTTLHSRGAIMDTVFGTEQGERPRYAPQKALKMLYTAVGELRKNRKKITDQAEKGVLNAIDKITEANEGSKAAIYHLLRERLGMSPQGHYGLVLPGATEEVVWPPQPAVARDIRSIDVRPDALRADLRPQPAVAPEVTSKEVTPDEILAILKAQIAYTGVTPTLIDWVHRDVLKRRFRRELHGLRLDREDIPKPDDGGYYSRLDVAIIFCLAEFKGRQLPSDLDLRELAQQIIDEGRQR